MTANLTLILRCPHGVAVGQVHTGKKDRAIPRDDKDTIQAEVPPLAGENVASE